MEVTQVIPHRNQVRQPDYYNKSPHGCRFRPTDAELILYYLKQKIQTGNHPECRLYQVNLYDYNPREQTSKDEYRGYDNDTWYFLTPRTPKDPNGIRPNRKTKDSWFWKATKKDKNVYKNERSRQVIGKKRT
ncbi:NAC domain-containing protein 2-like [Rutidosis leptorrhynchoides]|uniref:NAC domain-containing protein 2-like n=1 Tax=Rutidosis leptorrhynchoides TaxID=125765 RepID=UPI003A99330F